MEGKIPSVRAKIRINRTAQTKSGTAVAERPPSETVRSRRLPSLSAAHTPPATASGTTMMKASSASFAEFTSAGPITSSTGRRWLSDSPMSPVNTPLIQSQYCTGSERSVPSSSLSWSTDF